MEYKNFCLITKYLKYNCLSDEQMPNKRLIELMKAGKERGYSEQQLKEFFVRQGYKEEDIKEALRVVENNKNDGQEKQGEAIVELQPWIHSKSQLKRWLLAVGIFILSFLFMIDYLLGSPLAGILILTPILIYPLVMYKIYRVVYKRLTKNRRDITKIINRVRFVCFGVFSLVITATFSVLSTLYDIPFFYQLLVPFFFLSILSLFLYFKKRRKYPLELIFLILTMSVVISTIILILCYLIYALFILNIFHSVNLVTLYFTLTFSIMLSLVVYILMPGLLIRKILIEFMPPSEANQKKSIMKFLIITFVISLIISSTIIGVIAFTLSRNVYRGLERVKDDIQWEIMQDHRMLRRLFVQREFNTHNHAYPLLGEFYPNSSKDDLNYRNESLKYIIQECSDPKEECIVYDCDTNLKCEEKYYSNVEEFSRMINRIPSNVDVILTYKRISHNLTKVGVFLFHNEGVEQVLSSGLFLLEDPELQETKIAKEINEEWKNNYITTIKSLNEINVPKSWYKLILSFITNKASEDEWVILTSRSTSFYKRNYLNLLPWIVSQEYGWIKKNEINGTIFYDNTKNIDEHIARLKKSVSTFSKFYKEYLSKEHGIEKEYGIEIQNKHPLLMPSFSCNRIIDCVFGRASENLMEKIKIFEYNDEESGRIDQLEGEIIKNITVQSYKSALKEAENPQVDKLEKALRLKLAETNLLSQFILGTQICNNKYEYRAMILESNYTKFCESILRDGLCSIPLNKSVICDLLLYKNK